MLFYGDKDNPAFTEFQNGFRARMEAELNVPVWIYEESFDEGWLGHDPAHESTTERFLRDKYAGRGIDVIVPLGSYPLEFVQKRRETLLPEAKLVYFLLGPPQSIPGATGLILKLDLAPTLEVALSQNPESRHVLLIAGSTALDRATAQLFLPGGVQFLQERHSNADLQVIPPGTFDETRSLLAALPRDTITVYVAYHGDSAGQSFISTRILTDFSEITNRPMYGWLNSYAGRGIAGGSLVNSEATGAELGNLAACAVRGEKPGNIPEVSSGFRRNEFDWRQMKRWGIAMDKVPAGSIIINREYTVWEMYKWRIAGLLVLLAIAATLVAALARLTIAQRHNLKKLMYRSKLEALVAQFAAAFINVRADLAAVETERSFQRLLEFFNLGEISLFEFRGGTVQLRVLCPRTAPGIEPPPAPDLEHISPAAWQILRDAPIVACNLGQLGEEAGGLREVLRGHGFRSLVTFPLRCDESTFAVLSFSTARNEREWDPDMILTLRTIADIFGGALERQYAEEAARASRDRLTGIIESAMDAIVAVDGQQRIVVFNSSAERIFGCPIGEALGQPIERFIPLRFRVQHHAHVSDFAETGVTNRAAGTPGALRALRATGEEFPIEASISQVETDGRKLFTVIIRDITERKEAEEALQRSEQLKASILGSLRNHVVVLDSEGMVLASNKQESGSATESRFPGEKHGQSPAKDQCGLQKTGRDASYLEMWLQRQRAGDPVAATAVKGIRDVCEGVRDYYELECRGDSKPGEDQRWFLMSVTRLQGGASGAVISHQDITEQIKHRQAIQEFNGRLINAQEQERSRIAANCMTILTSNLPCWPSNYSSWKCPCPRISSGTVRKFRNSGIRPARSRPISSIFLINSTRPNCNTLGSPRPCGVSAVKSRNNIRLGSALTSRGCRRWILTFR